MLTSAEKDRLTRASAGQPAGELLRRYWSPVGVASELTAENPTQLVRISESSNTRASIPISWI